MERKIRQPSVSPPTLSRPRPDCVDEAFRRCAAAGRFAGVSEPAHAAFGVGLGGRPSGVRGVDPPRMNLQGRNNSQHARSAGVARSPSAGQPRVMRRDRSWWL